MSDKVKLTKEQAQTIGYFKESDDWTESSLVEAHAYNPNRWEDNANPINGMPLDTLIRALYIGYEIEETPEERLIMLVQHYEHRLKTASSSQEAEFFDGKLKGIREALSTLNIKIKWINE